MSGNDSIARVGNRNPLSTQVRDHLEELITNGTFPPGSRLPSEDELCERLDVSRPTLRAAFQSLEGAGIVVRRRGVGTFVRNVVPLQNNLTVNFGVTDLIERLGRTPGSRVVALKEVRAGDEEARALKIAPDDPVMRLERVRTADDVPVVYSVDIAPMSVLGTVPDPGEEQSMHRALRARRINVRGGVAKIAPSSAPMSIARELNIPARSPLLLLDQVDYDADDRPVLHSREWHVADAFEITVHRHGPY